MITKEEFFKYIEKYQEFEHSIEEIVRVVFGDSNNDFYDCNWYENVSGMLDIFIDSHFTEKGGDWVYYFLFEPVEDKRVVVKKEKDIFNEESEVEYHLNSLEELWNFLLTDISTYFKNV